MFCLTTFFSGLFLMQIAPTSSTNHSRPLRIARITNEPCRNQAIGKFIKDRYACDKFFYCGSNQVAISVNCPNGMIFNAQKEICDFPSNYVCVPEVRDDDAEHPSNVTIIQPTTTSTVTPTTSVDKDDHCPVDDGLRLVFLPNRNECHRYYICYHGHAIPMECIRELHWNAKLERCDFPDNAGCLITTTTPASTSVPFSPSNIKCPFRGEQIFPHPEQCNYFIYCINGYATVQQCPFFHYYDIFSKSCKWQTTVKCDSSKTTRKLVRKQG